MKSLQLDRNSVLTLREVDEPATNNGSIVTVEATGIGGSEYSGYLNPGIRTLPCAMGHGFAGLDSRGNRVAIYPLSGCGACEHCLNANTQLCDNWMLIGVQCDGGFSRKVVTQEHQQFELPENMTWEQSVFIEPFANSVNAWHRSGANKSDSIGVIGAGSLGLGVVACASDVGCTTVEIAENASSRKSAAVSLGATQAGSRLENQYDVVFDTVGSVATRAQAVSATKKGGCCVFLGFESPETTFNISEVIRSQKTLVGSFVYSKDQFREAIKLVANCESSWVTNIRYDQVEEHLNRFIRGDFSCVKVALRPNA